MATREMPVNRSPQAVSWARAMITCAWNCEMPVTTGGRRSSVGTIKSYETQLWVGGFRPLPSTRVSPVHRGSRPAKHRCSAGERHSAQLSAQAYGLAATRGSPPVFHSYSAGTANT
ncbi:hypothetical protein HAX54_010404 [Datura stramonium]|uniref:Uncharacterized protein n=1 Tax=Datura stramonium TaxID=4076 RepID=A0ABS8WZ31_DATST|nr:hypothetical protein [Datura stramonium]